MSNKKEIERAERLLPNGKPRYIHCYDNGGESIDRYFVVFTGRYRHKTGGEQWGLGMSGAPFHPMGFGQMSFTDTSFDYWGYSHLGKKIKFDNLPKDCQECVLQNYVYLWNIKDHPLYRED